MMNDEKDLRVRTKLFARRVIRLYCALPKSNAAAQILGRQALRSGTSVGANYREGHRARSKAEFISKIGDCLKEADENFVSAGKLQPLMKENDELLAILTTISKRAKGLE